MKIYKVETDSSNAQWIIPKNSEENLLDILCFDCSTKKNQLDDIEWYVHNSKNRKGNFYMGVPNALIFDQDVYDSDIFTLFEMAGEILPIHLETGQMLYALNILECVNMLNKNDTVYSIYESGIKSNRILNYAFYYDRISESSIFKTPDTSRSDIFTYSGVKFENDEFYYLYNKLKFTGLKFLEIYST